MNISIRVVSQSYSLWRFSVMAAFGQQPEENRWEQRLERNHGASVKPFLIPSVIKCHQKRLSLKMAKRFLPFTSMLASQKTFCKMWGFLYRNIGFALSPWLRGSQSAQKAELAIVISVLRKDKGSCSKFTIVLDFNWVFRGAVLMLAQQTQNKYQATDGKKSSSVLQGKCWMIWLNILKEKLW